MKGNFRKRVLSSLHQSKGSEMPVIMRTLRGDASLLRFCRSASSAKATWISRWYFLPAVECVLSRGRLLTALRLEAIGLPQISGYADKTLSISNNARTCGRTSLQRSPLTSLCVALLAVMSYAVAGAQTATTTTLSVNPASAANGSVFTMTATVKAGATPMTGGIVTFRDTCNSLTQVLGTVQVQSANGTKGNAVLLRQLGAIGTHSIVATFNAPKTFVSSSSTAQSVTTTGLYPTVANLAQTGGSAGSWSLTTTIVGVGSPNLSPSGNVSLLDTSNSNWSLGGGSLGAGTFGQQTVTAAGSPIGVGNNPQDLAAGDFDGDGVIDLAVLNNSDRNVSILIGDGSGGFTASTTKYATGRGAVAIVKADFNGDGKLDLAVANGTDGTISILLGKGDGTFNAQVTYSLSILLLVPTTPSAFAVGDFNGDGIPDIAAV